MQDTEDESSHLLDRMEMERRESLVLKTLDALARLSLLAVCSTTMAQRLQPFIKERKSSALILTSDKSLVTMRLGSSIAIAAFELLETWDCILPIRSSRLLEQERQDRILMETEMDSNAPRSEITILGGE